MRELKMREWKNVRVENVAPECRGGKHARHIAISTLFALLCATADFRRRICVGFSARFYARQRYRQVLPSARERWGSREE